MRTPGAAMDPESGPAGGSTANEPVRGGPAWATAQLSYQGVPLYPESESRKVAIPGEFRFAAPGIAIPRLG